MIRLANLVVIDHAFLVENLETIYSLYVSDMKSTRAVVNVTDTDKDKMASV